MDDIDYKNFDAMTFMDKICQKLSTEGLDREHSRDFKKLTNILKTKTTTDLTTMYTSAKSKCDLSR